MPYTAISIGWGGWHATVLDPDRNPNGNAYNVVSHNFMYDYMHTLGDGGAIYSNGPQADNWKQALKMTRNVAIRGTNTDFTFYTDAASRYVKVGGNFAYFQPFDSFNTGGCHTVGSHQDLQQLLLARRPGVSVLRLRRHGEVGQRLGVPGADAGGGAGADHARRGADGAVASPGAAIPAGGQPRRAGADREQRRQDLDQRDRLHTDSKVYVGKRLARDVQVLTTNYIFAKVPANQSGGTVPVVVTNAHGKSAVNQYSQLTYAANPIALPAQQRHRVQLSHPQLAA